MAIMTEFVSENPTSLANSSVTSSPREQQYRLIVRLFFFFHAAFARTENRDRGYRTFGDSKIQRLYNTF